MNLTITKTDNTITCGPFTWERSKRHLFRDGPGQWDLVSDPDAGLPHFTLKNYGGEPGPGFAGWKLVIGGPFDKAGAYATLDEALIGATPWLVDYLQEVVARKLGQLDKAIASLHLARGALRGAPMADRIIDNDIDRYTAYVENAELRLRRCNVADEPYHQDLLRANLNALDALKELRNVINKD